MTRWVANFILTLLFLAALPLAGYVGSVIASWRFPSGPTFECMGSPSALHHVVYLHGLDSFGPAWPEVMNREVLRALAAKLDVRIALPRAPGRAWPQEGREDLQTSLAWIEQAARVCFPAGARYGLVAFSDGGYMANRLVGSCVPHQADWIVSVGSAGDPDRRAPADLGGCGRLRLLVGRFDPTLGDCRNYASFLRRRGADVDLVEYPDVHRLPFRELHGVLAGLFADGSAR